MSKEKQPIVPEETVVFRAYDYERENYVYLPETGDVDLKQDHEQNFEFDHCPSSINIEYSFDGGVKFHAEKEVREALELSEFVKRQLSYVVTAYRWGDNENHSYTIGCFTEKKKAIDSAESHANFRGGKYQCEVDEYESNKYHDMLKNYGKSIYKTEVQ